MGSRKGFTLLELLVVMVIAAIVMATAVPSIGRMMAASDVQRSASVIVADLQRAHSLAARRRMPVRIIVDAANKTLRIRNFAGTDTTLGNVRRFGANGEYPLQTMTTTVSDLTVYPNGLAAGQISITVKAGAKSRTISMTRVGQIRVKSP
jgi:type II secretion system protein H